MYTQEWYIPYSSADSMRAGAGRPDPVSIYHCIVYSEKLLMIDRGTGTTVDSS